MKRGAHVQVTDLPLGTGIPKPTFPQNMVSTEVNITLNIYREVMYLQGPKPNKRNPRHVCLYTFTMKGILPNNCMEKISTYFHS